MGVDDRYSLRGYGTFLLQEIVAIYREISQYTGCSFITVESFKSSVDFYIKRGFKVLNDRGNFVDMALYMAQIDSEEHLKKTGT